MIGGTEHGAHLIGMAPHERPPVIVEAEITAGFPSPASDYVESPINLNTLLIAHPSATFMVRVRGDSMINAGIAPHDLMIVDRALTARSGNIVIAVINGDFTVKRLQTERGRAMLVSENTKYPTIDITDRTDVEIWGVVTYVVKPTR